MNLMKFFRFKRAFDRLRIFVWNRVWGMSIHPSSMISLTAKLDKTYPRGVIIKERCIVTFGATILAHDMVRQIRCDTIIEADCFIGARSIILPGIRVGPNAVVAAGAVVTRDVAPGTIVAGNPARVIKSGVNIGSFGRMADMIGLDRHRNRHQQRGQAESGAAAPGDQTTT